MSKIGVIREIDATGRLCVPKEMRELFKKAFKQTFA